MDLFVHIEWISMDRAKKNKRYGWGFYEYSFFFFIKTLWNISCLNLLCAAYLYGNLTDVKTIDYFVS